MKKILHDGVNLSFKAAGSGKSTYIFVHNAGGNHQFMDDQFQYFAQQGRVLSVDLRGHGDSDKPNQDYTVEGFAKDLAYICDNLAIEEATIVGLNYGAIVAIELANISSTLASHLVLINPPILMESWVKRLINDHIAELQDPYRLNFAEALVKTVLLNPTDKTKSIAITAFNTTSRPALISTYQNLLEWDKFSQQKIRNCNMSVLNIQTSHPFCNENSLTNLFSNIITRKVVGSGPWATLEVPDQVNVIIEQFLNALPNSAFTLK